MKQSPALWPVTNKSPDGTPLKYFAEIDTHASRSPYAYNIQVVNGSIPTQGAAFPFKTNGNSLSWAREWLDAFGTLDPNFQFDTSNDNRPLYVSYIIRANSSKTPVRQMSFAYSNGGSHRLQFGVDDSSVSGKPRFFACAASPQPTREYSNKEFKEGTTYFLVGKITTSQNRSDSVQLKVFGPGDVIPNSDKSMKWDVEVREWTDFLVTDVALALYGGDSGSLLFDELRIGSTWDVVAVAPKVEVAESASSGDSGSAPSADATEATDAPAGEEESSPLILGIIALGIVAFLVGGVAFYMFVLKPSKSAMPAKPKSAPKPVSKPPSAKEPEAAAAAPKEKAESGPTKPRRPKRPPPPPK